MSSSAKTRLNFFPHDRAGNLLFCSLKPQNSIDRPQNTGIDLPHLPNPQNISDRLMSIGIFQNCITRCWLATTCQPHIVSAGYLASQNGGNMRFITSAFFRIWISHTLRTLSILCALNAIFFASLFLIVVLPLRPLIVIPQRILGAEVENLPLLGTFITALVLMSASSRILGNSIKKPWDNDDRSS